MSLSSSRVASHCVRLKPGQDLKTELVRWARELRLQAAVLVSGVGSLEKVTLRLANGRNVTTFPGHHEIVSITGTLAESGLHVHLSASDETGRTVGGHLVEGNPIYTTCELTVLEQLDFSFDRQEDPTYGYKELVVRPRLSPSK